MSEKTEVFSAVQIEGEIRVRRLTIVGGTLVNGRCVVGSADVQPPKLELVEAAVQWDEVRQLQLDDGSGLAR